MNRRNICIMLRKSAQSCTLCSVHAVRQVVFTDVLIIGDLMRMARALLLLADTKQTLPLIGYSLKGLPGVQLPN